MIERQLMSEIFTYSFVKEGLMNETYYWEQNFQFIERVINASEVLVTYSKNQYNDDVKEKNIYFFLKSCIYNLIYENGKSYRIVAYNPKNILKMILDINGSESATLNISFPNEGIILSSSDSINRFDAYRYIEAILEIAKIYST